MGKAVMTKPAHSEPQVKPQEREPARLRILTVVAEQNKALEMAKQALSMMASELPKLRADRGSDPRLATPANYAAELCRMANAAIEPAIKNAQPYLMKDATHGK